MKKDEREEGVSLSNRFEHSRWQGRRGWFFWLSVFSGDGILTVYERILFPRSAADSSFLGIFDRGAFFGHPDAFFRGGTG